MKFKHGYIHDAIHAMSCTFHIEASKDPDASLDDRKLFVCPRCKETFCYCAGDADTSACNDCACELEDLGYGSEEIAEMYPP